MTSFTWMHWITVVAILTVAMGLILFSSFKFKGQVRIVSILVILVLTTMSLFVSVISLDKKTKKAILTHVENKRVLRTEEIIFKGYIINNGDYKIGVSELEIKLINHGKSVGHLKGDDFYRVNSIFSDIFTTKRGSKKLRPGIIINKFVLAKELMPGERKSFMVRFKFPPYLRDVDFKLKLFNDLAEMRIK